MGLFSVLGTATRGLQASQLGMEISGQNISNADVEGYSRKRVNTTADYRTDPRLGQIGMGVEIINVERYRSKEIEGQIQRQNEQIGYFETVDFYLESVENVFTEPGDTGLLNYMDTFFDSWQNLSNNPADLAARTMVKTNAEILGDAFKNTGKELQTLRNNTNGELERTVKRINTLAAEIYNLNTEIGAVEISNQNANDSRDARDRLLRELSKLINIEVIENDLGQISITTNGNMLVSPVSYEKLEMATSVFTNPDGSTFESIGVKWQRTKRDFMPKNGEVRALFDIRDSIIPNFSRRIDNLAKEIVANVNDQHRQGYNLTGYSGFDFFDPAVTGATDIQLSSSINSDIRNIAAAGGGTAQSGATISTTAAQLNFNDPPTQLSRSLGIAWNGTIHPPGEQARNIIPGSVQVFAGGNKLNEGSDYFVDYALGTVQMLNTNFDGIAKTIDFEFLSTNFAGPGDNSNALAIAGLRDAFTMVASGTGSNSATFSEYYTSFIAELGLDRSESESNLETRQFLVKQLQEHQDSVAGVSLDEEMAELIKFQHTYQASARIITTANQMLDVLLNL